MENEVITQTEYKHFSLRYYTKHTIEREEERIAELSRDLTDH